MMASGSPAYVFSCAEAFQAVTRAIHAPMFGSPPAAPFRESHARSAAMAAAGADSSISVDSRLHQRLRVLFETCSHIGRKSPGDAVRKTFLQRRRDGGYSPVD